MRETRKKRLFLSAGVMLFSAAILVACQSGPPQVAITNAKAVLSPAIIGEAMVTMEIANKGGPDVLTGAKTDIPGATVLIHVMQGRRMVKMDRVDVPSRGSLVFKMGGSHIMIEDMPRAMKEGSPFSLTLMFEKSGEKTLPLKLEGSMHMPVSNDHHM